MPVDLLLAAFAVLKQLHEAGQVLRLHRAAVFVEMPDQPIELKEQVVAVLQKEQILAQQFRNLNIQNIQFLLAAALFFFQKLSDFQKFGVALIAKLQLLLGDLIIDAFVFTNDRSDLTVEGFSL